MQLQSNNLSPQDSSKSLQRNESGMHPTSTDTHRFMSELFFFFKRHDRSRLKEVDVLAHEFRGREDELFDALEKQYILKSAWVPMKNQLEHYPESSERKVYSSPALLKHYEQSQEHIRNGWAHPKFHDYVWSTPTQAKEDKPDPCSGEASQQACTIKITANEPKREVLKQDATENEKNIPPHEPWAGQMCPASEIVRAESEWDADLNRSKHIHSTLLRDRIIQYCSQHCPKGILNLESMYQRHSFDGEKVLAALTSAHGPAPPWRAFNPWRESVYRFVLTKDPSVLPDVEMLLEVYHDREEELLLRMYSVFEKNSPTVQYAYAPGTYAETNSAQALQDALKYQASPAMMHPGCLSLDRTQTNSQRMVPYACSSLGQHLLGYNQGLNPHLTSGLNPYVSSESIGSSHWYNAPPPVDASTSIMEMLRKCRSSSNQMQPTMTVSSHSVPPITNMYSPHRTPIFSDVLKNNHNTTARPWAVPDPMNAYYNLRSYTARDATVPPYYRTPHFSYTDQYYLKSR